VLDAFGPGYRLPTKAMSPAAPRHGVVRGDVWLVGSGDPGIDAARLAELAARVKSGGIERITGSVLGDTGAFDRGWWAPGWLRGVSRHYVTRPTALAFDGNAGSGVPEASAAASFRAALTAHGVVVAGASGAGR